MDALVALEELLGDELDVWQLPAAASAHWRRAVIRNGREHARVHCVVKVCLERRVRLQPDEPGRHVHQFGANYYKPLAKKLTPRFRNSNIERFPLYRAYLSGRGA